jgi:hypothetical protein
MNKIRILDNESLIFVVGGLRGSRMLKSVAAVPDFEEDIVGCYGAFAPELRHGHERQHGLLLGYRKGHDASMAAIQNTR